MFGLFFGILCGAEKLFLSTRMTKEAWTRVVMAPMIYLTIDRLAETGIRFTNMYAPSAICSASRRIVDRQNSRKSGFLLMSVHQKRGPVCPVQITCGASQIMDMQLGTSGSGIWLYTRYHAKRTGFDYSFGHGRVH